MILVPNHYTSCARISGLIRNILWGRKAMNNFFSNKQEFFEVELNKIQYTSISEKTIGIWGGIYHPCISIRNYMPLTRIVSTFT